MLNYIKVFLFPIESIIPLTTNTARLSPSHVLILKGEGGLAEDSKALTEQIRAIDKARLVSKTGRLPERLIRLIEQAILNSLDM